MKTINQLIEKIEQAIHADNAQWVRQSPVNLYGPVAYGMSAGGKRIRPLLVLLGSQLFSDEVDKAIPVALAIEVFHNFTLLHDDIMDKADKRRGRLTVHRQYSENAAILSGDAMAFLAYQRLLQGPSESLNALASLFTQTALEVCEGQQFDMDFEHRIDVTTSEYLEMIRLKTAVLLACALKSGALVGGSDEDSANQVYQIGINLGIAFQLQDDLLDTFGNESEFGKSIGGDITANKKTYLLINALEMASPDQRKEIDAWLSKKEFDRQEKIEAVKEIFNSLNIKEKTKNLIQAYMQESIGLLAGLPVPSERKSDLEALCLKLAERIV
jgi:geranylgeranyl diphosphate synthase, type II